MKCIILAGGTGERLWPLSRKNYPKQFIEIRKNRSIFQETIVRNLPFCDEFFVVTNENYRYIVEGQLQAFQGLKYRIFLEQTAQNTTLPSAIASMYCNDTEQLLIVSSDHIIDGNHYKENILDGKNALNTGKMVMYGIQSQSEHVGYGYLICDNNKNVLAYKEQTDDDTIKTLHNQKNCFWNAGIFMCTAGDYLYELKKSQPDLWNICRQAKRHLDASGKVILLKKERIAEAPSISIEEAIIGKTDKLSMIEAQFTWKRIMDFQTLSEYSERKKDASYITEACDDVTIMNYASDQLVVANHLEHAMIVNTEDAIYISDKKYVSNIKDIIRKHYDTEKAIFDEGRIFYQSWGKKETLNYGIGYKVKKLTIYPGKSLTLHRHLQRSENWLIVSGWATITIGTETKSYGKNENIQIPMNTLHRLANKGTEDLIIIETSIGSDLGWNDIYHTNQSINVKIEDSDIVRLEPAFKDYLWGGTNLKEKFGKKCDYATIAESWELSTHSAGQSAIAEGKYKGMLLSEYLNRIGKEALGWKCQSFDKFPLLIKLIDAQQALSIQVHPDDDYALPTENEYGKNEMWYIVDCKPSAWLYLGFKKNMSIQEVEERIHNNTLEEVLNKIPVKKGQVYFVNAGTIHAIGAGIIICEIQQNSNATYRLYDYGRRDRYGELRELHLQKGLDVLNLTQYQPEDNFQTKIEENGYTRWLLGECKYFSSYMYKIDNQATIWMDQSSFSSIIILEGEGTITVEKSTLKFSKGESYFIPADKMVAQIKGKCQLILTKL